MRREAMQRSVDRVPSRFRGVCGVVQKRGFRGQSGFLIYQAIYATDQPAATVAERREQLAAGSMHRFA